MLYLTLLYIALRMLLGLRLWSIPVVAFPAVLLMPRAFVDTSVMRLPRTLLDNRMSWILVFSNVLVKFLIAHHPRVVDVFDRDVLERWNPSLAICVVISETHPRANTEYVQLPSAS